MDSPWNSQAPATSAAAATRRRPAAETLAGDAAGEGEGQGVARRPWAREMYSQISHIYIYVYLYICIYVYIS